MSEEEGEKWGLVPTHAYAVLDIREYKVPSETERFFRYLLETCVWDRYLLIFVLMAYTVYFVWASLGNSRSLNDDVFPYEYGIQTNILYLKKESWQDESSNFILYFFRDLDSFSWKIPGATYVGREDTVKMTQEIGLQIYKNIWTLIQEQLRK